MVTDLYLIRHGESVANVEPIIGGMRGDAGLTARGREQASLLEARLRAQGPRADLLYASTLPRARETAEYVARALGLPVEHDNEWQELRPGEADGLAVAEWEERYGGREFATGRDPYRPFAPGGESWATFLVRVGRALVGVVARHPEQRVAVVCHGGVLDASFYHAFGLGPTGNRVRFQPLNTSITHWRYQPGDGAGGAEDAPSWTLVTFNDAAHLREGAEAPREAVPTPVEGTG